MKIKRVGEEIKFVVKVQPKASHSEVTGIQDGYLKVKVNAPPIKGQANKECVRILADWLGVKNSQVKIERGGSSRIKKVKVRGNSEKLIEKFKNLV